MRFHRVVEAVERLIGARPGQKLEVNFRAATLETTIRRAGRRLALALTAGAAILGTALTAISERVPGVAARDVRHRRAAADARARGRPGPTTQLVSTRLEVDVDLPALGDHVVISSAGLATPFFRTERITTFSSTNAMIANTSADQPALESSEALRLERPSGWSVVRPSVAGHRVPTGTRPVTVVPDPGRLVDLELAVERAEAVGDALQARTVAGRARVEPRAVVGDR